jgi:hypothetical protein
MSCWVAQNSQKMALTANKVSVAQAQHKGEGQVAQEVFVKHRAKLKNEQPTAGFRFKVLEQPRSLSFHFM